MKATEKTALQALIDELNSRMVYEYSYDTWNAYKRAKVLATELLEKEKEQIINSWNSGAAETSKERISGNKLYPKCKYGSSEEYYKSKYEQ